MCTMDGTGKIVLNKRILRELVVDQKYTNKINDYRLINCLEAFYLENLKQWSKSFRFGPKDNYHKTVFSHRV